MVSGAEQYAIYRETSLDGAFDTAVATIPAPGLTWTDTTGLEYDVMYYYKIRALSSTRERSPFSNTVSDTTRRRATLTAPSFYSWSSTSTTITLEWSGTTDGSDSYTIIRDTSETGKFEHVVTSVLKPSSSYTDTGLSPGTTYWYKISARSDDGEFSDYSEPYSATTTGSGGGGGIISDDEVLEIAKAELALTLGTNAAVLSTDSSSSAYNVTDITSSPWTSTYYFNDYVCDDPIALETLESPITLNGSIYTTTQPTPYEIHQTCDVQLSGCDISAIISDLQTIGTAVSGTKRYEFTDGTVWIMDAATATYTGE
jgi:hypothetical protein